ncbi:MAG TPA: DUF721 domain-containing protein [Candidatus Baltobacteraceae bacterium]|nr:DUF721 domain-containing protein [Candidatus Baltobacteraceae bacterium]
MSGPAWRAPVRMGEAVAAALQKLGLENGVRQHEVWQVWAAVVGPQIARQAQPHTFSRGRLIVHVTDSVWLHQLRMMRHHILAALNAKLQPLEIREIVLRVGEFPAIAPEPIPEITHPPLAELTKEELADIDAALDPLGDVPFRNALQRLWERAAQDAKIGQRNVKSRQGQKRYGSL